VIADFLMIGSPPLPSAPVSGVCVPAAGVPAAGVPIPENGLVVPEGATGILMSSGLPGMSFCGSSEM